MNKTTIGVIFGGKSSEHEVSKVSARNVIDAINKDKYNVVEIYIDRNTGDWSVNGESVNPWKLKDICDFALPILHGPNGEDGTVQGLLELINIPYGGCGVLGCATAMDKIVAKEIFAFEDIPQVPYLTATDYDLNDDQRRKILVYKIKSALNLPLFVKPANMGSSVGITKVTSWDDLSAALDEALKYDCRIVIEHGVNARELETAVMGNSELVNGSIGEIVTSAGFYDYESKYLSDNSDLIIPAMLTESQQMEILQMAKRAYRALGCFGFARVDFLMDKESGEIFINEINAIPGFTQISMFPKLMMDAGLSYPEIIEKIVEYGYERHNVKNHRKDH